MPELEPELPPDKEAAAPHLAELLVPLGSHAVGRTVKQIDLRRHYGVNALAIQRHGQAIHEPVGKVRLAPGDLLLAQGRNSALQALHASRDLVLLGPVRLPARRPGKLVPAIAIMTAVVLLPALGVTTILVSGFLGALAMILTGALTTQEAYEDMDWSVVVLLAAIIPLGLAMRDTGTADWVAQGLVGFVKPLGPYGVLAAIYVVGVLLTSVISNAAAALVLVPVAIATGAELGVSPMPFIIAVMFAASSSFITPIGYQTNTFIYGPGGYRFGDFLRVGAPLNVLLAVASTIVIPRFFPF
jgi:di/tricarboxylate transporter